MEKKLASLIILLSIIISCKKDQETFSEKDAAIIENNQELKLGEVKKWYGDQVQKGTNVKTNAAAKAFKFNSFKIDWEKAESVDQPKHNWWIVDLPGQPTFAKVKSGYRKLAFMRDSTGSIQARILEIVPDALYIQRSRKATTKTFSGRVFIYDRQYRLKKGIVLSGGKVVGEIKPQANATKTASLKSKIQSIQVVENCVWEQSSYIDAEGVVTIYAEKICTYSYYDDGADAISGGNGGGSATGGDYLGSGDNGYYYGPPPANLPGGQQPGIDPKSLMDCFGMVNDPNAKMVVTVYSQEPFPGTLFNYGPNSVGHTAIGLTLTTGNTSITQVVGFYPDATGLGKMQAPSKIVDNSGLAFNSSISYTVNANQFNAVTTFIANPPNTYDLTGFNCTSFVYTACQAGGITIPDPYNSIGLSGPGGATIAMTPAGLGFSIKNSGSNKNVNKNGGYMPTSKGPCN